MIFPEKHLRLTESIFGFGGYILSILDNPKNIDDIWEEFEKINGTESFPAYHSFDKLILTIIFLYCLGAIKFDDNFYITRASS